MIKKNIKEKLVGATGSISGATSILGSWQICHNICLGLIALLSVVGITVTGMPLLFLTKIVVPVWTIAVVLFLFTAGMYLHKRCLSGRLLTVNAGLIIAGTPLFPERSAVFWFVGGSIAFAGILLFIKDKLEEKRCAHEHHG